MNPLTQAPMIWEAFFLILCRVGTVFMIAPIFGNRSVPSQLKVAFSLLVSLVLLPVATAKLTRLPEDMPGFLGLAGTELLIGALIGFAVLLTFVAIQSAGNIVGLQMGFSLANVVNPLTADNASLIDQFYGLLAALIFLAINGHHALLLSLQQTFDLVPVDRSGFLLPPGPVLMQWGGQIFAIASRVSLPIMAALLLADMALAVVARSVPQLNVFVVGMPAKIIVGFLILSLTLPLTAMIMGNLFTGLGGSIAFLLRGF